MEEEDEIKKWLNKRIEERYNKSFTLVYYDQNIEIRYCENFQDMFFSACIMSHGEREEIFYSVPMLKGFDTVISRAKGLIKSWDNMKKWEKTPAGVLKCAAAKACLKVRWN